MEGCLRGESDGDGRGRLSAALLGSPHLELPAVAVSVSVAVAVLLTGVGFFWRTEDTIADVVWLAVVATNLGKRYRLGQSIRRRGRDWLADSTARSCGGAGASARSSPSELWALRGSSSKSSAATSSA